MKTAIYTRVSTTKQEGKNQEKQLKKYSEKKGYEIIHIFSDVISGNEKNRPAFDEMYHYARKRLFEHILFWDISRFSRAGTLHTLKKLKELENLGMTWESYQEPYFNSIGEFKDVVLSIISTLAKIERQKISERTKAGIENSKKRHLIGKRGKDKKPRKTRSDRGLKRYAPKDREITLKKLKER
tara:strand:+ start:97 stop:648 length:552 start_codon:yes stop_codon:yes gene_type:complete